ncbi:MAG TPA: hypothetical protein VKB46_13460 [Pyrinomonadaceae bacterium]|nr:hypothetical protein [Pyrinomonadaceae bacterium]
MSLSQKVFKLMLVAYPREFRREYGPQMTQVFRDCCRAGEHRAAGARWHLWLRTVTDLLVSATREHLATFRKDNSAMNNRQQNLLALGTCLAIIVIAFSLLSYGRSHEVAAILFFGYTLDALVTAGVVGNVIVFLLKMTKLNPIRTALWTIMVVHFLLAIFALMIGSRADPNFRLGSVLIGYVVSFLFWFSLHWAWAKGNNQLAASS